ncbi:unnamed protein product [Rhizoctonia solani]|uniref:Uncharacterized protein n=1 Tax=Rhizoctonia solani TaxID=456999 RepID=A0A8H3BZC8_9AGAM|nr:unnamed protein product [Rhizoctonia solani]
MHSTRPHARHRRRPGTGAPTPSQPFPQAPAPLRAKLYEYLEEIPNDSVSVQDSYKGHSSSNVQESPPEGTLRPKRIYIPLPPSQTPVAIPPSLSQYPLFKPRRRNIAPGDKAIQLASPFHLLVGPSLPLGPSPLTAPPLQLNPLNPRGLDPEQDARRSPPRSRSSATRPPSPRQPSPAGNKHLFDVPGPMMLDQFDALSELSPIKKLDRNIYAATRAFLIDMTSAGNHLAVITNEGGALVWEIPKSFGQQFSNQVYILDLKEADATFCGLPIYLDQIKQIAKVFEVLSPIANFAFDYTTNSVAILSFGGMICFFVIEGGYPLWKATIRGYGHPSSLDIYDWGMLIGWKNGTILELFTPLSTNVISTLQFMNNADSGVENDENSHTCHCYDARFRTLWVAHSTRASLLAVHVPVEADNPRPESVHNNPSQVFEKIIEVPTASPISTISLAPRDVNESEHLNMVRMYVMDNSGLNRITITQRTIESINHATSTLTAGTLQKERHVPEPKGLDGAQEDLHTNSPGPVTNKDPPKSNQTEAFAQHPVPVCRDENKLGSRKSPKKIIKLRVDVSADWDSIKAKANCITILPLTQFISSTISNKPTAFLTFDHGDIPGPMFMVDTFLAYGMTDGRIGLVFRRNGARAVVKLPAAFGRSASIVDLAVFGNHLACITDGGGAVVWNIPNAHGRGRGTLTTPLLQVQPCGLRKVKWYDQGKIAFLSASEVCLFDIHELRPFFGDLFVPWKDLVQFAQRYSVSSFLVSFTFDSSDATLATISVDSVLSIWSTETQRTIWQEKIPGDGDPSSIHILDNGLIIGRNRGCTIQLLARRSANVLSTITFVHAHNQDAKTSRQMYAHFCYDDRLRTVWIINSERSSLIAVQVSIALNNSDLGAGEALGTFEKIAEFPTPVPIDGLSALMSEDAQGPSLAVVTTVSKETRVDLLALDQSIFEDSLQVLHAETPSSRITESLNGVPASLETEKLKEIIKQSKIHQYFEAKDQSLSPKLGMITEPSITEVIISGAMDIAHTKEMSTDDMFECLTRHGCPDLTNSMNPSAYSKGFVMAGGFGDIWKGKLHDGTTVAIKVWRFRTINEDAGKDIKVPHITI